MQHNMAERKRKKRDEDNCGRKKWKRKASTQLMYMSMRNNRLRRSPGRISATTLSLSMMIFLLNSRCSFQDENVQSDDENDDDDDYIGAKMNANALSVDSGEEEDGRHLTMLQGINGMLSEAFKDL